MIFKKIKLFILDILFPIDCLGCHQEGAWLCANCLEKINLTTEAKCVVCKQPSQNGATHKACQAETSLDGIIIAGHFEDKLLQTAIHRFKYNFVQDLGTDLAKILIKKISGSPMPYLDLKPILIPIPLSQKRLNWRGFNQAQILTQILSRETELAHREDLLKRIKNTKAQAKFNRAKRLHNLQNAFAINPEKKEEIKNTKILLVDDVLTTGSTMNECARVLKDNGADQVWGIVLARG